MFSGVVKIADIDDYITPSQNCIKPLIDKEKELKIKSESGAKISKKIQIEVNDFEMHTGIDNSEIGNFNLNSNTQKVFAEPDLIKIKDKNKKTAKVSLNDCLACNGCVTTAETLLIQAQSVDEFLKNSLNANLEGKLSVVCASPQSILSLAEYFKLSQEETLRRLSFILRMAGVNYLFNFNTANFLTLMQSYQEFKDKIINQNDSSQGSGSNFIISSECPGWICYAEKKIGDWVIPHLSKLKSPQQILGHLIKKILFEKLGKETYLTCIMPCFDKKLEATRETHKFDKYLEVDTVVSTIELLELFSKLNIDFEDKNSFQKEIPQIYVPFINLINSIDLLSNIQVDSSAMQLDTEDYKIFFSTLENYSSNGYSEFILNEYIKEFMLPKNINFRVERKLGKNSDYKEIFLYVEGNQSPIISFCLVYGFRNIQNFIRNKGKIKYSYLEVMACPGGCINGGGQLRPKDQNITARDLLKKIEEKFNEDLKQETLSGKREEFGLKIKNDFDFVYKYLVNPQKELNINNPNYMKQIFETEFKALDKSNTLNLKWKLSKYFFFSSTTLFLGSSFTYKKYKTLHNSSNINRPAQINQINQINSLPTYSRRQVQEHSTKESRIWVTFRDGVYDVTEWMDVHPGGGDKIMMVAGGSLDAFWEMYAFHKKPDIFEILEKFRIGNLDPKDIIDPKTLPNFDSLKKENMTRSEDLLKLQTFPYCAECPSDKLIKFFYTPNEYFFVRNHNTVPMNITKEDYKFQVSNKFNNKKLKLTIEDLKTKFQKQSVETIIMCTGNRRSQMDKPATPKGLAWNVGSIGNGIWDGVLVRDLLHEIGIDNSNCKGLHLIVNGLDKDFQGTYYSISIPLEYAFREDTDVILAYGYNGGEIPYEHGYPLRLIVPGVVGVRNVKWIKNIEISDTESQGAFQQRDYKIIPNNVDVEKVDLSKLPALMEHVVNSAIVEPKSGHLLNQREQGDQVVIKGWAIGHFGAKLSKIEISLDQGKSWDKIENLKFNQNNKGKVFGWTLWEYPVDTKNMKEKKFDVWVRAEDIEGNIQPVNCEDIWNFRGLMNNSIHKISINIL